MKKFMLMTALIIVSMTCMGERYTITYVKGNVSHKGAKCIKGKTIEGNYERGGSMKDFNFSSDKDVIKFVSATNGKKIRIGKPLNGQKGTGTFGFVIDDGAIGRNIPLGTQDIRYETEQLLIEDDYAAITIFSTKKSGAKFVLTFDKGAGEERVELPDDTDKELLIPNYLFEGSTKREIPARLDYVKSDGTVVPMNEEMIITYVPGN